MGTVDVSRETLDDFTLTVPPYRIELGDLPQSPGKMFKLAESLGWETHAWHSVGLVAPTLFLDGSKEGDKNQHIAGDVRFEGYTANMYTVEARDPASRAIGFQAFFLGRSYQSGKKGTLGSFEKARVADPAGLPRLLHFDYEPISQTRGKFETEKSWKARLNDAQKMADNMNLAHNDGSFHWEYARWFEVVGDFENWINEWKGFTNA